MICDEINYKVWDRIGLKRSHDFASVVFDARFQYYLPMFTRCYITSCSNGLFQLMMYVCYLWTS